VLPFTAEEFFEVFARYNTAIWPAQIGAAGLGLLALILLLRPGSAANTAISLILAVFWLLMGIGYHLLFFASINTLAYAFGLVFVVQAILLVFDGVIRRHIAFGAERGWRGWVAWTLIAYALVIYPLVGLIGSHPYPRAPLFGVAPCPTTIFTLGLLLLSNASPRLFVIPLVWSVIGGSAAVLLAVPQDYGLILAGAIAGMFLLGQHMRPAANSRTPA
jgi:Family of unknown function (DUF6064)